MSGKAYKRKAGEFEIRILPDGWVVMLAPDEALMEIGRAIEGQVNEAEESEKGNDGRATEADRADGAGGADER